MIVLVTGIVLILSLLIGALSFSAIPKLSKKYNEENTEENTCEKQSDIFSLKNRKNIIIIVVTALLCAVTTALLYNKGVEMIQLTKYIIVLLSLLSVMIIDRHTHLIPNKIVLSLLGAGAITLAIEFFVSRETFFASLLASVVGLMVLVVMFYTLGRFTRNGIGMGDIKLIGAMGWVIGLSSTMFAILFSLIVSCIVAIVLMFRKKKDKDDKIPFGPFMFFGYIILLSLIWGL